MTDIRNPGDPESEIPVDDDNRDQSPFERPPFEEDPEAQHAPGADDGPDGDPPPMQATSRTGNDNIREGRVGGVMGAPSATNGQGQGD